MGNEDKLTEKGLAMEMLGEIQRQSKRWMIAFFVVLSLWAATIGGFVWFLNQYDFESYVQDGDGQNYLNCDVGGNVYNGAEVPKAEKEER
ncbi:MAG: hypothetical protein K2L07_11145 [Lachnospiraceae bacterium]|nr:hypothetical protein [Lachnospiraceae bacterium]